MKQQVDYFNHFQNMGFFNVYNTPKNTNNKPKLDFIGYQFNSPTYNWNVSKSPNPHWPRPDPFLLTLGYSDPNNPILQTPDIIVNNDLTQTDFLYYDYTVDDLKRDGVLKTQFNIQKLDGDTGLDSAGPWGNPNNLFPYELKRVMLKVRYLKNVYDIDKVASTIKTASGETYTKEEFFNRFGDYLVPVRDDGEYIGVAPYHKISGVSALQRWGDDTTIKSIAIPIDDNNNFYTPKIINSYGYVEHDKKQYGLYTVESNGCIYPFLNLFGYQDGFFPSELSQPSTFYPLSLCQGREYDTRVYTYNNEKYYYKLGNGGPYIQNPVQVVENPNTTDYRFNGASDYSTNYYEYEATEYTNRSYYWQKYTCYPLTFDYSLYYEDALSTGQRMIFFDYESDREFDYFDVMGLNSCIFNQRELENYFKAFGVEFVYMFDDVEPLPEDNFVQGQKVRHASLINQIGSLEFSKVRHNSLINQPATQAVKKVRHIL